MRRRAFLTTPALAGFAQAAATEAEIVAVGDGIPHTPAEYASLLNRLAEQVKPDSYSRGGVVETLESRFAAMLGKEAAVWMPTGTLANHLAVRILAGEKRRVTVQHECHLFNDCGDCAQTLSGLHMVPLARGKATFGVDDFEEAISRGQSGRVAVPFGALQIETPVRRMRGQSFEWETLKRIASMAREKGIGLHLDGARLFLESAYTKRPVKEYAAQFDTVYISLYKYFNAASGAVLAGPKRLLADLFHTRRMFGGGINHVWPSAVVALHYLENFETRFAKAVAASEQVIHTLGRDGNFEIERVAQGTNIFRFRATSVNASVYQHRASLVGLRLGEPDTGGWFNAQVNETWNRAEPSAIVSRFQQGLG